ncbi:MAG: GFA family protein [Pseudomonadales bacterium]|nr:GFA family protein [Pseudomonadales bacterium]MCP5184261.1 GFA family protein [Pseudomonadales bacterium]
MIEGGCFCGAIRFAIGDGQHLVANCHCTYCRRISTAPFVTWLIAPVAEFRYTRGEPKELVSSDRGRRYFCSACGTHVACTILDRPEHIDIPTGCLDAPERFSPTADFHTESRLPWITTT